MEFNLSQNKKTRRVYGTKFSVYFSPKGERYEANIVCYNQSDQVLEVRTDRPMDRQTYCTNRQTGRQTYVHFT